MNILLVWESKHGSTAEISHAIGRALSERGLQVTLSEAAAGLPDEEFDAYIIGSAVYAGHWLKHVKQFVHDNPNRLQAHPVWLFSSGPIGDPPKPQEPPIDIAEISEWTEPRQHVVFAGKLDRAGLTFAERAIVTALRAPHGDFRDWDAIQAWAGEIADALQQEQAPRHEPP